MRLADLLAGLSRLADLGFGMEAGSALRSCVLATRLASALDLPDDDVRSAFYTALLHHVGCVGYAHETTRLLGDDLRANTAASRTDTASPRDVLTTFLPTLTAGLPVLARARAAIGVVMRGQRWGDAFTTAACEVGRESARRLGLPDGVQQSLYHVYDLWGRDGRPGELSGDAIPVGARIARLTGVAALAESLGGPDAVRETLRRRAGGMLDPGLVGEFLGPSGAWLAELDRADLRAVVLGSEPPPHVTAPEVSEVAEVFGDLADLKSACFVGHSRAVAALASSAGAHVGLDGAGCADLTVAGLLHDVGRVAVSNAVWEKSGPLRPAEWEQVRLHPYHSERILDGSEVLGRLAPVVGRHHERLDGSGYHRHATAADQSLPVRVLAAADAYRTWLEPRPHREPMSPEDAGDRLRVLADRGRLDRDAAGAVLAAATGRGPASSRHTAGGGLSAREVEVLRLLAHGCSNAEIASRLVISRRTAEHHVQHIYTKIGTSSRAAATLFAVEHDLLLEPEE